MSETADRLRAVLAERAPSCTKRTKPSEPARGEGFESFEGSVHDSANASDPIRRLYRERVKAAVRRVHATDPRLAEAMVDSWMERIAIIEADGGDPAEAERIACEQAEREAGMLPTERPLIRAADRELGDWLAGGEGL